MAPHHSNNDTAVVEEQTLKQREQIILTAQEQAGFLRSEKTVILSSVDRHGFPHSIAMWFVVDEDGTIWMTTYGRSQKVLNLQRNPKVALLIETGKGYKELKGLLIRGEAEIVRDEDLTLQTMLRVHEKMTGAYPKDAEGEAGRSQARKRVVLKVKPQRIASWDHSKLKRAR